jgi:hypothetical protein
MRTRHVLLALSALALAGCLGPGRPPHAVLPPIAEEYFACDKCGSLHGGIYGKGPLASFATPGAAQCWHRWQPISRADFQQRAARDFPAEWEKAGDFVKRPAP